MSWIRTEEMIIEKGNKYYNNYESKTPGWSYCCTGTNAKGIKDGIGRPGANVLDNCVGFAVGAYVETFMKNYKGNPKAEEIYDKNVKLKYNKNFPFKLSCNANGLFDLIRVSTGKPRVDKYCSLEYLNRRKNPSLKVLEPYLIKFEDKPPLGGLIAWGNSSGVNHVAYICGVSSDGNHIKTLHAGWKYPQWTNTVSGGYTPTLRDYDRVLSEHTYGYKGKCLGYLQNPAVIESYDSIQPPLIVDTLQPKPTTVNIIGLKNNDSSYIQHIKIFYKWDNDVTTTDYDGVAITSDTHFNVTIQKPRDAAYISVIPVIVTNDGTMYEGDIYLKQLTKSYPCIQIVNNNKEIINAVPHIYTGAEWKEVIPTIRTNNNWYELYNTDKERVK